VPLTNNETDKANAETDKAKAEAEAATSCAQGRSRPPKATQRHLRRPDLGTMTGRLSRLLA
jgi:hypothetical protein